VHARQGKRLQLGSPVNIHSCTDRRSLGSLARVRPGEGCTANLTTVGCLFLAVVSPLSRLQELYLGNRSRMIEYLHAVSGLQLAGMIVLFWKLRKGDHN